MNKKETIDLTEGYYENGSPNPEVKEECLLCSEPHNPHIPCAEQREREWKKKRNKIIEQIFEDFSETFKNLAKYDKE